MEVLANFTKTSANCFSTTPVTKVRNIGEVPECHKLETRKAMEAKCQKEGKGKRKLVMKQDSGDSQDLNKSLGRKRKTRPVHDLKDSKAECKVQEVGTLIDVPNVVHLSSGTAIVKEKLELVLDKLKRRDTRKIFAEPVDGKEVEFYYDVIKEPMDFLTITQKLDRGVYKYLKEFERDISLVYNNAFVFNAPGTIFYKEALAIKNLATELLSSLRTDPENFRTKCSRRPGSRDGTNFASERRQTYKPHTSIDENNSILFQAYSKSKELKIVSGNKCRYAESLTQFLKGCGPTAQSVGKKKLERLNATITSADYHRNAIGWQSNIPDFASTLARSTMDMYDVLRGGVVQASTTMKALSKMWEKRIQTPDNHMPMEVPSKPSVIVSPSLRIPGGSTSNMLPTVGRGFNASTGLREYISTSGDEAFNVSNVWDKSNKPHNSSFMQMMQNTTNSSPGQTTVASSASRMQESVCPAYGNPSIDSFPCQSMTLPSYGGVSNNNQAIDSTGALDSHDPNILNLIQTMANEKVPFSEAKESWEAKFLSQF